MGLLLLVCAGYLWGCATQSVAERDTATQPAQEELQAAVVLRWSTASERDCYGYHVYRGPTVDGPFVRLTNQVIPGGGTTHDVRSYRFEDFDPLEPGIYFYFVEEVAMDGTTRRLTPPRRFEI
ncbi:MAG: hypothetical protein AAGC60_25305 [Acidobacteriota bacterium]